MVTDPARKRRTDPGNPDVCPVFDLHKAFSPRQTQEWAAAGCRSAGIGCLDCKARLTEHMLERLAADPRPPAGVRRPPRHRLGHPARGLEAGPRRGRRRPWTRSARP